MKLFASPVVRLALRAVVAGVSAAAVFYHSHAVGAAAWHGAIVAGVLAFCEVFTPLNSLVGVFKIIAPPPPAPAPAPTPARKKK